MIRSTLIVALFLASAPPLAADDRVYEAQVALDALGYDVGRPDGDYGPKTAAAFSAYCSASGLPDDNSIDVTDLIELHTASKASVNIPLLGDYAFKPSGLPLVITDTYKNKYPRCAETSHFNSMDQLQASKYIIAEYEPLFSANSFETYSGWQDGSYEDYTVVFSKIIFNLHHLCLSGSDNACNEVLTLVREFVRTNAMVEARDPRNLKYGTELAYMNIHRILIPVISAYSTVIQRLGTPDDHEEIGKWAYSAILQNTYDPFGKEGFKSRDFLRLPPLIKQGLCNDLRKQNHSLQASYLAGMYGAIWNDAHMFNLPFDTLDFVLGSVDKNGALPCEAMRGAVAIVYSGGTLSNILQVAYMGKLHGIDPTSLKNFDKVHAVAKFLLDAAEDFDVILPYAETNQGSWCHEDYRQQCIDTPFGRQAGYGWIRLYRLLFPDSEQLQRIHALAEEMATADNLTEERKLALGAILKSNYPTEMIKKNLPENKSGFTETSTTVFEDVMEVNRGSPYCLYSLEPKQSSAP